MDERPTTLLHLVIHSPCWMVRTGLRAVITEASGYRIVQELEAMAPDALRTDPPPHVLVVHVLSDQGAVLDGVALVRKHLPALPMLAVGNMNWRTVRQLLQLGVRGVLSLDANADELHRALRTVADGGVHTNRWMLRYLERPGGNAQRGTAVKLTARERQLLRWMAHRDAPTYAAIAEQLGVSPRTVETHRDHLFRKLGVRSRSALVRVAMEHRLLG